MFNAFKRNVVVTVETKDKTETAYFARTGGLTKNILEAKLFSLTGAIKCIKDQTITTNTPYAHQLSVHNAKTLETLREIVKHQKANPAK